MTIKIDAHAHFHDCFDLQTFLDFAWRNFRRGASGDGAQAPSCLMVAATDSGDPLRRIKDRAGKLRPPWSIAGVTECGSLIVSRDGCPELVILPGRQVVTKEKLEVLALGTAHPVRPGRGVQQTLDETAQAGGLAVLPWGFGKWWFRRGRTVRDTVLSRAGRAAGETSEWFLGDNGGRPQCGWPPRLFQVAGKLGMRVLPGSDPLPFPWQISRVGSYGFELSGSLDLDRPSRSIQLLLQRMHEQPAIYGRREPLVGFCRAQVAMHLRKFSTRT